ncbi:hypothetical protein SAMN06298216_1710 [Spirosomataceae bacterium TFI 002]|nr:hypothetical protein SAMN06298216_1710 [Spirosomataceae bacterium TFI 002]
MVYYSYHDDSIPNAAKTNILTVKPDILIDNTPGGLYGPGNFNSGCIPSYYTQLGIKVFSNITGGYEATTRPPYTTSLANNLNRIIAIKVDQATRDFLDEVSSFPNTSQKAYLEAIYNKCQSEGLKLILNPRVDSFDPWLLSHCDYLVSDEEYDGRGLTSSEQVDLNKIIVISRSVTTQQTAENLTAAAYNNSFAFYYPSYDANYQVWDSWLQSYFQATVQSQPTLIINGNTNITIGQSTTLSMPSCSHPIEWYDNPTATQPISSGATITVFPATNQTYYADCKKPLCTILRASLTINICVNNQIIPNVLTGENKIYKAPNSLQLNSQVASGANLQLQAGSQLLLLQGTNIQSGSVFKSEIKSCSE